MPDIEVTQQQMYSLLLTIHKDVIELKGDMRQQRETVADHEARLRAIEGEEDVTRRVTDMENDIKAIRQEVEDLKRRVWAIPSASVLLAAAAIILTIVRTF